MIDLDVYEYRTRIVRRRLLQVIEAEMYGIRCRADCAAELIRVIRTGGGPSRSAEYRQQLARLEKILKQIRPGDGADIPVPVILPLLADIAELLSEEADLDGQET